MARGSGAAPGHDENPYFAPVATNPNNSTTASSNSNPQQRRASDPAVSPHPHPASAEPTTPARELPPNLSASRSRPNIFNTAHRQQSTVALRRPPRAQPSRATLNPTVDDTQYDSSHSEGRQQQPQRRRAAHSENTATGGRRRSSSEPQRPTWLDVAAQDGGQSAQQNLNSLPEGEAQGPVKAPRRMTSWLSRIPTRSRPADQQSQHSSNYEDNYDDEVDSRIVDLLDAVDPEVSTLTSTTNVQNSLFIPYLGRFVNRRPTYDVSWGPAREPAPQKHKEATPPRDHTTHPAPPPTGQQEPLGDVAEEPSPQGSDENTQRPMAQRLTSHVQDTHYAVLPHGTSLDGWTQEDIDRLNDHVRHMMHSRRSKFRRSMQGFGRYVRRPLGFFVTLYATLITLFGLAWVLFLIGWIYVGAEKQHYLINIIDYTLVALFAIMGDGLAPFRMVDTYHMIYIAHYHNLSWKLRKKLLLPDLPDQNDLPTQTGVIRDSNDIESARAPSPDQSEIERGQFSVLTQKQQEKLQHHQKKYARSHTFYRPHETETHYAFPLWLLVAITSLLDLHSCLQISLGSVTWGIKPNKRPFSLTTIILCISITVNATAGLLIWIGDKKTRKKDVAERMARQELTEEAMRKVQKDKEEEEAKEREREREERELAEGGGRKSINMPRISLDKSFDKLTAAVKGEKGDKGESSSGSSPKKKDAVKEEDEDEEKVSAAS